VDFPWRKKLKRQNSSSADCKKFTTLSYRFIISDDGEMHPDVPRDCLHPTIFHVATEKPCWIYPCVWWCPKEFEISPGMEI